MIARVLFCAVLATAALAAQPKFEIAGRYWMPQLAGRIRVESNGLGTDIDATRDLGMPDTSFPQGSVTIQGRRSRLSFTYTPFDYSGDRVVTRTVVFNGRPYTVGTQVLSSLEVRHLQLSWAWQFIDVHSGAFKLGPVIEADGFLMHGRLRAPALGADEKEDLSVGLPTVGAALDINPHRMVNIYGQVAGMNAGDYGYFIGSDAGVKIRPVRHLLFTAGYRTFNLRAKRSPDFLRLNIHGPFVGAGFSF